MTLLKLFEIMWRLITRGMATVNDGISQVALSNIRAGETKENNGTPELG